MSIMAIDPVCSQAILPMRVTLYPSGMLCVTNIPSINDNDILFCSELNREHTSESFRSLGRTVLRYAKANLKKLSILRKFDLWPLIAVSNTDLGQKNTNHKYPSRKICHFLLCYTTLSFETRRGSHRPLCTSALLKSTCTGEG